MHQKTLLLLPFFLIANLYSQVWKTYVPYNKKGKWGYADTSCTLKVQPFSVNRLGFFDFYGFAKTRDSNDYCGLINSKLKTILPVKFYDIEVKSKKYIVAEREREKYKLYNTSGILVFPDTYKSIEVPEIESNYLLLLSFDNVLSLYKYDEKLKKQVFVRKHENVVKASFSLNYDSEEIESLNYTIRTRSDKATYSVKTGEEIETNEFDDIQNEFVIPDFMHNPGMAGAPPMQEPVLPYTIIEKLKDDTQITQRKNNYYNPYLIEVCINKKWGVISTQNDIIVPIAYDTLLRCKNYSLHDSPKEKAELGWIARLNGKYGIVSTNSENNVEFKYEGLKYFSASYILGTLNHKYGVLNHGGNVVIPFEVDSFEYASRSLNWYTCSHELILVGIEGGKKALYGTLGGKTDYLFTEIRRNTYSRGYLLKSLVLNADNLYGLAVCNPHGFIYIPCQFVYIGDADVSIEDLHYYLVKTTENNWAYIDHLGRKFYEE